MSRREEIAAGLAGVRARIDQACSTAGRDPASVVLIAVTKTFPAADVAHLAELGVQDVGENKDQEAAPKAQACAELTAAPLRWHFVGQLQTNKARSVARYCDVVHAVDRLRLVKALSRASADRPRSVECLVQVDLDPHSGEHRGGVAPGKVSDLAAAIDAAPGLVLRGVMAVAPYPRADGPDPATAFARLAEVSAALVQRYPAASAISAGMSGDLEAAVAAGATHLRVGSAILGHRPSPG